MEKQNNQHGVIAAANHPQPAVATEIPNGPGPVSLTLGMYRVGIAFNPGGHTLVNQIKSKAAQLIDSIDASNSPAVIAAIKTELLTIVESIPVPEGYNELEAAEIRRLRD